MIESPKLQSEILAICFALQTGFCPSNISPELASGHGYTLLWSAPFVRDTDTNRKQKEKAELEKLRAFAKESKKPRKKKMDNLARLADELEVYSEYDRETFKKLEYEKIEVISPKAVLIDGNWFPKSQLKVDVDSNLYSAGWLYDKTYRKANG
jgi:hypothetical protein